MNEFIHTTTISERRVSAKLIIALLVFFVLTGFVSTCGAFDELSRFEGTKKCMGVEFKIVVYADTAENASKAIEAAYERIEQIESRLSDYRASSEVNQLSASSPHEEFQDVSVDLWNVACRAYQISRKTDGAFDVTVGPLTKMWRYARTRKKLPDQRMLDEAKRAVGYEYIEFDHTKKRLRLTHRDMRLDFGGIGKGYAADQAIKVLKDNGIASALVDASGDIVASDPPPGKPAWVVAIKNLRDRDSQTSVKLFNQAIATSGDAFQYLEIDGVQYSHILNPKTGIGVTTQSQVTVIANSATLADALASAVSVLGPEKGINLIESIENVEAQVMFLHNDRDDVANCKSSGFPYK